MGNYIDITGQKFGRLTAIKRVGSDRKGSAKWLCQCECGNEVIVRSKHLRDSHTKSCGCLAKEKNRMSKNIKHGATRGGKPERLYVIWQNMKARCNNPNSTRYKNYGGRCISICDEWKDYEVFRLWAKNNGYDDTLSIDRIDVNGDYCPENCRWATTKEQASNTTKNRCVEFRGETHTITQWANEFGVLPSALFYHLRKGQDHIEQILSKYYNARQSDQRIG